MIYSAQWDLLWLTKVWHLLPGRTYWGYLSPEPVGLCSRFKQNTWRLKINQSDVASSKWSLLSCLAPQHSTIAAFTTCPNELRLRRECRGSLWQWPGWTGWGISASDVFEETDRGGTVEISKEGCWSWNWQPMRRFWEGVMKEDMRWVELRLEKVGWLDMSGQFIDSKMYSSWCNYWFQSMVGIPCLDDSKVSADGVHQHWENTKLLLTTDYENPCPLEWVNLIFWTSLPEHAASLSSSQVDSFRFFLFPIN